eukprot:CAMPEP_0172859748 /NCGR_PEP_ID=MMETSP1075-20121228/71084_1 /TAXON_ID=2916 /ORGANISM="Ceratium fusus, Strain PA161109" /LENGTH=32 /DNA_ID= /DNA_START= /DNA_END= /DNA_ORIENTATION=
MDAWWPAAYCFVHAWHHLSWSAAECTCGEEVG